MLTYAALPGVPMDFLNATARASWGFIRNQDDRYGVKIVAEESVSLKWQVDEYSYSIARELRAAQGAGLRDPRRPAALLRVPARAGRGHGLRPRRDRSQLNAVQPDLSGPRPFTPAEPEGDRPGVDGRHARVLQRVALPVIAGYGAGLLQPQPCASFVARGPGCGATSAKTTTSTTCVRSTGGPCLRPCATGPDGEAGVHDHAHGRAEPARSSDPLALPIPGLEGNGWNVALRTPSIGSDYLGGPLSAARQHGRGVYAWLGDA
jgi:hypothetical protein